MGTTNYNIVISNADHFIKMARALEVKTIFRASVRISRHHQYHIELEEVGIDGQRHADLYKALVEFQGEPAFLMFSASHFIPLGWDWDSETGLLTRSPANKTEAMDALLSIGANPEQVKKIKSLSAKELLEVIDSSDGDETNLTTRKRATSTDLEFDANPPLNFAVLRVKLKHSNKLDYTIETPYSEQMESTRKAFEERLRTEIPNVDIVYGVIGGRD